MLKIVVVQLTTLCGQLLVAGFHGTTLDAELREKLARGALGGIIVFKRNLTGNVLDVRTITAAARVAAATTGEMPPPFVCVDQEGGRVARLKAPVIALPSMRELARTRSIDLVREAGALLGADLAALGFSSGLSPVLDVDSNPKNPIIGDRAFGDDPHAVSRFALAFAEGLRAAGVAACGKHYPGHGDTERDSHFELPVVRHDLDRLRSVEFAPFSAAARANIDALMTAHVVYTALDAARPATLSPAIATTLLRTELGFRGVLFSDDLEMKALAAPIEETSVTAIEAGCDALLVCSDAALVERAHRALVQRAEADATFRTRCQEAYERFRALRVRVPPRPETNDHALRAHFEAHPRAAAIARIAEAVAS